MADKVTISLSTWDRITLTNIVGAGGGNRAMFRQAMKALDLLELSPEEGAEVGLQTLGPNRVVWRDVLKEWKIEFPQERLAFIQMALQAPDAVLPYDRKMKVLLKKLGVETEEA